MRARRRLVALGLLLVVMAGCDDGDQTPEPPRDEVVTSALERAKREGWEARWADLYPVGALPPWLCAFMVFGLGLAAPVGVAGALGVLALRDALAASRARRAGRSAREALPMAPGPIAIHGRVVSIESEATDAIVVEVEQIGTEHHTKQSCSVVWTEIDRRTIVAPFTVELAGGQRVRIEPDPTTTRLVDDLGPPERRGKDQRMRRARLQIGESVYVSGLLERRVDAAAGMRGEISGWLLRAAAGVPMLASTHPLEREHARRAGQRSWWGFCFLAAAAFFLWMLHAPYLALVARHEVGTAVVVDKAKERRDKETWYLVTVVNAETEQVFREALDEDDFERIERGARVPVVYRPDDVRYSQIGREASAYHFKLLESILWLGGLLGFYFYMRGRRLPWHERRRIVDKEPGRLESEPAEVGERAGVA